MSVALSPIINPHQSILRRRHVIDGRCRTVPCQQRRRQSLAAMQSTNCKYQVPPTPCKTNYAIRKSAYGGKRARQKNLARGTKSRTPSPNKKRRMRPSRKATNKSAERSTKKNANKQLVQSQYFQNLGLIGVGSFSQVFKVQNAVSNNIYAIKKSSSFLNTREAVSEALNEVEIMRMLQQETLSEKNKKNCENIWIVKFHDFWISYDRQLHQIYDYYEHGTLLDIVQYNERLNYLQILEIIKQICNGLVLIHSLNIVHIDIKPSNIFITGDYILKIGDFGISINLNNDNIDYNKSLESGDPIYIAPELLTFDRKLTNGINTKTDIFSLGIILLELLCDIKAPSQGHIFHNLRRNVIDFNIMEPSPIKKYKKTKTKPKYKEKKENNKFSFKFTSQNINFEDVNNEIIEDIDIEIKHLCKIMLSENSKLRPDCSQILNKIHEILNNEGYIEHFKTCKPLKSLALPPKTIINTRDNKTINNSGGASHCNSTKKVETHWFYQESPKCYNSLFHFNPSQSPIVNITDEFQLNLNSAFDNAQNQKSPLLFNSKNMQKSPFPFDNKHKQKITKIRKTVVKKKQNNDSKNLDCDDFRPRNLLFNFM